MDRMHSDAQFAGSSSVPTHVEMMGFLGMGNFYSIIRYMAYSIINDATVPTITFVEGLYPNA